MAVPKRTFVWSPKFEAIAREYEEPLRGWALVSSRLQWENWPRLRAEVVAHVRGELRRHGCRGAIGTLGMEAEDVADEAIRLMLSGKGRIAIGWTWERLITELRRLASCRLRMLFKLKEARAVRSEWEAEPAPDGAEPVSVLQRLRDEQAEERRAAWEREEELEQWRKRIERYLADRPALNEVFGCLWAGLSKPPEIAARLGIDAREAVRLKKRFARAMARFVEAEREAN